VIEFEATFRIMTTLKLTGRSRVRFLMRFFFFLIYLILSAVLGPGVHSASNRNEYQKHTNNNVSGE
jgi:hypothetical protein